MKDAQNLNIIKLPQELRTHSEGLHITGFRVDLT